MYDGAWGPPRGEMVELIECQPLVMMMISDGCNRLYTDLMLWAYHLRNNKPG